jgi:hypothetical protein
LGSPVAIVRPVGFGAWLDFKFLFGGSEYQTRHKSLSAILSSYQVSYAPTSYPDTDSVLISLKTSDGMAT